MSAVTEKLNQAFLRPLRESVIRHSQLPEKPLTVDLALPKPPRLRVYIYSLVGGAGERGRREYKVVLRVPGQRKGGYQSFDHSDHRVALVIGYRTDLDVFVLWDASLHPYFTSGGNIQVKDTTVHAAAATGRAKQLRLLSSGVNEVVIACQSWNLAQAIDDRIAWTGGVTESEWATFRS
jgi:hypothetical protein